MAAERLIEKSKGGRPECENEKPSSLTFVAFVPGIYQPQDVRNALFRSCMEGTSLRSIIESGDYRNEEDPLRAMVSRGEMNSNTLTREGWLKQDKNNMDAFVDYVRDTCALDFMAGACSMPSEQFRDLQLSSREYSDLGITLDDVERYFGKVTAWSERKRLGTDVNRIQSVVDPTQQSYAADSLSSESEENDSDAVDAYFQTLVRDASKIKD